jgi:hypothetical protein
MDRQPWLLRGAADSLIIDAARAPGPAEGPEARAELLGEQLRLLSCGEVTAPVELVVVDQLGIGPLGPTPRGLIGLAGKVPVPEEELRAACRPLR